MRAVVVDRWQEPDELVVSDVAEPATPAGSVKIATRAAALNFFDLLIVRGQYQVKPPFPFVPGGEFAGEIVEVGEASHRLPASAGVRYGLYYMGAADTWSPPNKTTHPKSQSEHALRLSRRVSFWVCNFFAPGGRPNPFKRLVGLRTPRKHGETLR